MMGNLLVDRNPRPVVSALAWGIAVPMALGGYTSAVLNSLAVVGVLIVLGFYFRGLEA
ncbi:MAG TPA: hypothetical protein PLO69_06430 [Gammaproteobacteria bacterium]|nr:hypothetical protein [Gammaproteobacteria bacterium]